jgi:hypothetical protein
VLEAWFAARAGYRLGADSVFYDNPATGVYFAWSWRAVPGSVAPDELPLELELKTGCAEFFLLEAELEVEALCHAFELVVAEGTGACSWRAENASVVAGQRASRLQSGLPPLGAAPRTSNNAVWQWNRVRAVYGDRLAMVESLPCSVPQVTWLMGGRRSTLLTGVVWTDLLPIALPCVDVVLVVDSYAGTTQVLPHIALAPWLERCEARGAEHTFGRGGGVFRAGLPHHLVDGDQADRLWEMARTLGCERSLHPVGADEILDREDLATLPSQAPSSSAREPDSSTRRPPSLA